MSSEPPRHESLHRYDRRSRTASAAPLLARQLTIREEASGKVGKPRRIRTTSEDGRGKTERVASSRELKENELSTRPKENCHEDYRVSACRPVGSSRRRRSGRRRGRRKD